MLSYRKLTEMQAKMLTPKKKSKSPQNNYPYLLLSQGVFSTLEVLDQCQHENLRTRPRRDPRSEALPRYLPGQAGQG